LRPSTFKVSTGLPGPGGFVYNLCASMDANQEPSIFNINLLRAALERLDLNDVAQRTLELAEDYMPGCSFIDAQGNVHYGETLREILGLVICLATEDEVNGDSDERSEGEVDEVPFWVASWLDELFPDIAERLRTALAEATWGNASAPEVE